MITSRHRIIAICLSFTFFFPLILAAQIGNQDALAISNAMDYNYFFRHLKYLSSDGLQGRGTGTPGYDKAANYVANELKTNGLVPFGDAGTFFQQVDLLKTTIEKEAFTLQIEKNTSFISASYGKDISIVLNPKYENFDEKQKMVFVGYGNIIPDKNIDDYEGVDVKGKTVIVALGGPRGMEHPDFGNRNAKFQNAISRGASGLILFYPKANLLQQVIFNKVHGFLSKEMLALADTSVESLVNVDLRLLLFAKKGFVKKILALNGISLKKALRDMANGKNSSIALASELLCSYNLITDDVLCKNVVALLPGADPVLKDEFVVFGAHLDGLGIDQPVKGDSIYNGMLDNASGVAALLSISKAFTLLDQNPRRSIIFVAYTAEEKGLLGSAYFIHRNKVNSGEIVANVNVDMLAQTIETADMAPLGATQSNLSEAAEWAARSLDLKVDHNQEAERLYIERSDQLSFIKKGIPALFIAAGFTALDPKRDGEKTFNKWIKNTYSTPFDDLEQSYSDEAFRKAIAFNFLTTFYISNTMGQVRWNEDSWLYKKYSSGRKK
jgi:hypothetical protein